MSLKHLTTEDQADWQVTGSSGFASSAILSPAQITGDVDDYDPTGFRVSNVIEKSVLRIDLDANHDITGLVPSSPVKGDRVIISNVSAFNFKLKNNNAGSVAANRFILKGDITIEEDESLELYYDTTSLRWRVTNQV